MVNENEIYKLIEASSEVTGSYYMEYDNNVLKIIDGVEGTHEEELSKDNCYKLSDIFKKLGDELSK